MKTVLTFLLAAALVCTAAPSSNAEPHQVIQGTQVHLTLLSGISSAVARDGDPFVAVVAEPVYLGTQLLLPAGTRVNGIIGTVAKARLFRSFAGRLT
jgi:type IV secretory pathway VirB10-like protein